MAYDSAAFKARWKSDPAFRASKKASYKRWLLKQSPEKKKAMQFSAKKSYKAWSQRPENKLKFRKWQQEYKNRHRMRILARLAIRRSRENGLPFDENYLFSLQGMRPLDCECCGTVFRYVNVSKVGHPHSDGPTLDKVVQAQGYVDGNVGIICWRCNSLKKDATLKELEQLVAYVKRFSA